MTDRDAKEAKFRQWLEKVANDPEYELQKIEYDDGMQPAIFGFGYSVDASDEQRATFVFVRRKRIEHTHDHGWKPT